MSPEVFLQFYQDADLQAYIHRFTTKAREAAKDAEQEAWLAVAQAPDGVSKEGLKAAVVTSVASFVWQERKHRRLTRWLGDLERIEIHMDI